MNIQSFNIGDKITRTEPYEFRTPPKYNDSLHMLVEQDPVYGFDLVGQELTFLGVKNGGVNLQCKSAGNVYLSLSDKSKTDWTEGWDLYESVGITEKEEPTITVKYWQDSTWWINNVCGALGMIIILLHYEGNHESANFIASMFVAGFMIGTGFSQQIIKLFKR